MNNDSWRDRFNKTHQKVDLVPDFSFEARFKGAVAGVDEAGRGPLAGPVVTAAVVLNPDNFPSGLNDSKKLSAPKRDQLFAQLVDVASIGIGIAEPEEIDRINVLAATMIAMQRAVADLPLSPAAVLIDGNRTPKFDIPSQAIVKGDSKSLSIAASSIIAKVTRDRLMVLADYRFTGFGLAGHKGYPTKTHRDALIEIGVSPLHRRSYAPVNAALTGMNKSLKTK